MDRLKFWMLAGLVFCTAMATASCKLPERFNDNYNAYVSFPRAGAIIAAGESGTISGTVYDWEDLETERIDKMLFIVNGRTIGESTATIGSSVYFGHMIADWTPEEPGEYYLQVYSSRRGNWAISQAVRVCVLDISLESPELYSGGYSGTQGYQGECEIPARSPDARPGSLNFSAVSLPESLTYFPGWWDPTGFEYYFTEETPPAGCGDLPTTISFLASAGDPNDDIVFVKVDLTYDFHLHTISLTQLLNPLGGASLDAKSFSATSNFPRSFVAQEINESFEVIWTAYAIGRSGEVLASDGPYTIPVDPCVYEEVSPLSLPFEAPIFVVPEFIPSVETCPPGTYFDQGPDSGRCIDIFIPAVGSGEDSGGNENDGNQNSGSCTLSIAICSSQGLSFDSTTCSCVPIQ